MDKDEVLDTFYVAQGAIRMLCATGDRSWQAKLKEVTDAEYAVEQLYAKLARVEGLAMEFGAMEIGANTAADRSEYPQDHLQNVGRAQAYCECMEKLREALGEKETG